MANTFEIGSQGIEKIQKSSSSTVEYWSCNTNSHKPMEEIFSRWYNMTNRPTAIYVNSDYYAISLINLMILAGVKIPQELSIIGTDGITMGQDCIVPLTTVSQPKYEQGTEGAKLLFSLIHGEKNVKSEIVLEPNLEIRNSTAILAKTNISDNGCSISASK